MSAEAKISVVWAAAVEMKTSKYCTEQGTTNTFFLKSLCRPQAFEERRLLANAERRIAAARCRIADVKRSPEQLEATRRLADPQQRLAEAQQRLADAQQRLSEARLPLESRDSAAQLRLESRKCGSWKLQTYSCVCDRFFRPNYNSVELHVSRGKDFCGLGSGRRDEDE